MNRKSNTLIQGKLIADPELFYTKGGTSICKFDIDTEYQGKNNENIISVNTWNKVADACAEHLTKGSIVKVTGILGRVEETSKLFIEASSVEFVKHEGGF